MINHLLKCPSLSEILTIKCWPYTIFTLCSTFVENDLRNYIESIKYTIYIRKINYQRSSLAIYPLARSRIKILVKDLFTSGTDFLHIKRSTRLLALNDWTRWWYCVENKISFKKEGLPSFNDCYKCFLWEVCDTFVHCTHLCMTIFAH